LYIAVDLGEGRYSRKGSTRNEDFGRSQRSLSSSQNGGGHGLRFAGRHPETALHRSCPLQNSPSSQAVSSGMFLQPAEGTQRSNVQLTSSAQSVSSGV
jgi:hypothetical protein